MMERTDKGHAIAPWTSLFTLYDKMIILRQSFEQIVPDDPLYKGECPMTHFIAMGVRAMLLTNFE